MTQKDNSKRIIPGRWSSQCKGIKLFWIWKIAKELPSLQWTKGEKCMNYFVCLYIFLSEWHIILLSSIKSL